MSRTNAIAMRAAIATTCMGLATLAHGAEFARFEREGKTFISMYGRIEKGDELKFEEATKGVSDAIVLLRGPGGQAGAALSIGIAIRRKGFATAVIGGNECNSGCAFIWLAGRPRMLDGGTAVGFHSAISTLADGRKVPTHVGNALVGAYLNEIGITTRAIIHLMTPPHDSVVLLSAKEAKAFGISVTWLDARQGHLLSKPQDDWSRFGEWVQVERHDEREPAIARAAELRKRNGNVAVFSLKDGGYAVVLGPYRTKATAEATALVDSGDLPRGGVAVSGERFDEHSWGHRPGGSPSVVTGDVDRRARPAR